MNSFAQTIDELRHQPRCWLVTGVAGFIGSNLLEFLLRHGQQVRGLDNFATGHHHNLDEVQRLVGDAAWARFNFIEGDLTNLADCEQAVEGCEYVLHQGALGSVPRSLKDPLASHAANATGTLNLLQAAREHGVERFVYASSSSVYGDHPDLPKQEPRTGRCLSPYAATKLIDEIYADVFCRCYGMQAVGLRYFNVFGRRQDPHCPYAAVIPCWIDALLDQSPIYINGDGETSRDFCYIDNVVQANVLAACQPMPEASHAAYNIAFGGRTTLNELFELIRSSLQGVIPTQHFDNAAPEYRDFRDGDVRHSHADISAAREHLNYHPTHDVEQGMKEAVAWYVANHRAKIPVV